MRRRPEGTSRSPLTWSSASPTSAIAGPTRASSNSPASVNATLRVVRFIRRTPSRSSIARRRWLRLDTDTRCSTRGAAEIPGAGHGDESVEIAEVDIAHCSI